MPGKPFTPVTRRRGAIAVVTLATALSLAGCGSDDADGGAHGGTDNAAPGKTAPDNATPGKPSASAPSTDTPPPAHRPTDTSDRVEEDLLTLRTVQLQSALRSIHPALGSPEDIEKAGEQCADLRRNATHPDQRAARRFSSGKHTVTEADGRRINAMLLKDYCY
ncbi:hypothetical protein [Streptomyces coffeae]|uniref:Lipoprotein n=1 Tax=Streptomyces coffeae TaxID=621382 RepID=A0ABS1NMV0_9ACTN|nr:hypothetical protein [Streptomyces coffeae]MBL1101417.1 hypothetical protein [Streptomyces coffeae]